MFDKIIRYDISDLVTPETTCVIDIDGIIFKVAAVSESRSIEVTNLKTNEVLEFNNRTEFWGRSRTSIGKSSYLAGINAELAENGLEEYTKEDFSIEDVAKPNISLSTTKEYVQKYIKSVLTFCGCTNYILLVGGDTNFRDDLNLPVKYKANRKNMLKPTNLDALRSWAKTLDNVYISEDMEGDDVLSVYGFRGYCDYLKTGKFSYMVSTNDKDAMHTPSLLFDWTKEESEFVRPYYYMVPSVSDDVGDLEITKHSLKGYSLKFLAYQLTVGDDSDGYSAYKYLNFPKGTYGNQKFYNDFNDLESPEDILEKIIEVYGRFFPEGLVQFEKPCGEVVKISWQEWLNTQFLCAYMKRSMKDSMDIYKLYEKFNVELEYK